MTDVDDPEFLQQPARAHRLESLEEHLNAAARLSRALWCTLESDRLFSDRRDQEALAELASQVSDHASAARYAFYQKEKEGSRQ